MGNIPRCVCAATGPVHEMVLHRSKRFWMACGVGMLFFWRFIHIDMQIRELSNELQRVNSRIRVHSGGTPPPSLLVERSGAQDCEEDTRCTCDGTLVYGRKFVDGGTRATVAEAMEMGCFHRSVSGAISCTNEEMGGDPAFGTAKLCYCLAGMPSIEAAGLPFKALLHVANVVKGARLSEFCTSHAENYKNTG